MNFNSKDDLARQLGTGLADLDMGLRLRYEITRKFAPYLGASYESKFGRTADLVRLSGTRPSALRLSIGLRTWF
jgi:copper resistance protein B